MNLAELRRAMQLSQDELAQTLQIGQGAVAKIEKHADMHVTMLRRFIEVIGGELEIVARFPDRAVKFRSFSDLSDKAGI